MAEFRKPRKLTVNTARDYGEIEIVDSCRGGFVRADIGVESPVQLRRLSDWIRRAAIHLEEQQWLKKQKQKQKRTKSN